MAAGLLAVGCAQPVSEQPGQDTIAEEMESTTVELTEPRRVPEPEPEPEPDPGREPSPKSTPHEEPYELPPSIEFVFGEGAGHERASIIEAIESISGFFDQQFGQQVNEATILVFEDIDELGRAIVQALNTPATHLNLTRDIYAQAYPRLVAVYIGHDAYDGAVPVSMLAHEWFHVLQFALASPDGGLLALHPRWMAEGNAVYAEVVLSEHEARPGVRDHYFSSCFGSDVSLGTLEVNDDLEAIQRMDGAEYCLGFLATDLLVSNTGEEALLDYWYRIGEGEPWGAAFATAFGQPPEAFYSEFDIYNQAPP